LHISFCQGLQHTAQLMHLVPSSFILQKG
jgi:hypothetical protein